MKGDDVAVVFFGDGAVQTGSFHETMNMASLWSARVLFVCENNGWAEFSSHVEHTKVGEVASYGSTYGINAVRVDGSDVKAVADGAHELLVAIRRGEGPGLLECVISRLGSHYEGDLRRSGESVRRPRREAESQLARHRRELRGARRDRCSARRRWKMRWNSRSDHRYRIQRRIPAFCSNGPFREGPDDRRSGPHGPRGILSKSGDGVVVLGEDVVAGGPFGVTKGLAAASGLRS